MSDSPSPPPHNRLNVMMFKRRIARQIESIDYETEDSECDYKESECESVADSELESESSENEYSRSLNLRKRRKLVEEKEKEDTMLVPKKGRTDTTMVQEGKQHETNPRRRKLVEEKEKEDTMLVPKKKKTDTTMVQEGKQHETNPRRRKLVKEKEKEDTMLVPKKKRTDTTMVQEGKQKEATKNIRTHKKCTASSASSVKKRRIRKLKKCEVCGRKQLNIWRHMKSKHSGEKEKKTKDKKRISGRGYIVRMCPIKNCLAIVERMRDHLVRKHRINNKSKKIQLLLEKAIPIVDLIESETESEPAPKIRKKPTLTPEKRKSPMPKIDGNKKKKQVIVVVSDTESEFDEDSEVEKATPIVDPVESENESEPAPKIRKKPTLTPEKRKSPMPKIDGNKKKKQVIVVVSDTESEFDEDSEVEKATPIVDPVESENESEPAPKIKKEPTLTHEKRKLPMPKIDGNKKKKQVIVVGSDTESEFDEDSQVAGYAESYWDTSEKDANVQRAIRRYKEQSSGDFMANSEIQRFIRWLQEVPNLKEYRVAKQHAAQAYRYWKHASPNLTVQSIFERRSLNGWIGDNLEGKTGGTLRSYLSSVRHFIDYLTSSDIIKEEEFPRVVRFKEHLKYISQRLAKRVKIRRTVVETEEIETMLLPVDFKNFLESDVSKECERALTTTPPNEMHAPTFVNLRDYLLLRIMQANAQRPMAIRGITEESVRKAKTTEDGGAVIMITHHKTAETGPVMLSLNRTMFQMVRTFARLCRNIPNLKHDRNRSLFTTWPNEDGVCVPLNSSGVNTAVQRIWAKGPCSKKISATRIRKATSTHVRRACPGSREVLAKHMSHSSQTADRYYALHSQREIARPVGQLIENVMTAKQPAIHMSIHWPKPVNYEILALPAPPEWRQPAPPEWQQPAPPEWQQPAPPESQQPAPPEWQQQDSGNNSTEQFITEENMYVPSPLNEQNIAWSEDEDKEEDVPTQERMYEKAVQKHKRRSFTPADGAQLVRLCEENIRSGNVRRMDIMMTLTTSEEGRLLILRLKDDFVGQDFWKRITDRIHYERRRRQNK